MGAYDARLLFSHGRIERMLKKSEPLANVVAHIERTQASIKKRQDPSTAPNLIPIIQKNIF